jgi:formylglycine-generating enzyme required for sulfatase activity
VTNYLWGTNWPPPNNVANLAGSERAKERNPDRVGRYIREYRDFSPYTASPAPFSTNAAWFKANAAGFHHLIGNVWEMCKEGTNNIVGLGASWRTGEPEKSRYDYMNKAPGLGELDLGFRCALELGEENAQ